MPATRFILGNWRIMNDVAKALVVLGLALLVLGGMLWIGGRMPWFGRLPGDIHIEREHYKFYLPLTTCLIISSVVTLLFWAIHRR